MADEAVVETTETVVETQGGAEKAQTPAIGETPVVETGNEVEQLRAALKKANAEAAERRHKLTQYEEAERKRAEAEMSEAEKASKRLAEAQARADELENRMRGVLVRHAVEMAAATMRFHDPADAFALADLSNVKNDEDGNVEGVTDALKALAKSKPHLIRGAEPPANLNAQARSNAATGMSDDEIRMFAARFGVRPEYVKQVLRS